MAIDVYDRAAGYKRLARCLGHTATVRPAFPSQHTAAAQGGAADGGARAERTVRRRVQGPLPARLSRWGSGLAGGVSSHLAWAGQVTHLDWSLDSRYLMSNSTSYEILYHEATTGRLSKARRAPASAPAPAPRVC